MHTQVVTGNARCDRARIVGDDAAALAGGHILIHLEAEDGHVAERADLPAVNAAAGALRAILQQEQAMLACDSADRGGFPARRSCGSE